MQVEAIRPRFTLYGITFGGPEASGVAYQYDVTTLGFNGWLGELVQLPVGTLVGQRCLVRITQKVAAGDNIFIQARPGGEVVREALHVDGVAGYAQATIGSVALFAIGHYALFELCCDSPQRWNLLYTNGTIT